MKVNGCGSIPRSASIDVLEKGAAGWDFVRYNGYVGYVSAQYLTYNVGTDQAQDASTWANCRACASSSRLRKRRPAGRSTLTAIFP